MKVIHSIMIGMLIGMIVLLVSYLFWIQGGRITRRIDTQSMSTKIQSMGKLMSTRHVVTTSISSKKDLAEEIFGSEVLGKINQSLFKDNLTMSIEGVVTAGVDLHQLNESNISPQGDTVVITLPAAEIFDVYLSENTQQFERQIGLLTKGDPNLETKVRNYALELIKENALQEGILSQAQQDASTSITRFLHALNPELTISYRY